MFSLLLFCFCRTIVYLFKLNYKTSVDLCFVVSGSQGSVSKKRKRIIKKNANVTLFIGLLYKKPIQNMHFFQTETFVFAGGTSVLSGNVVHVTS
jgi:hypothetical protein